MRVLSLFLLTISVMPLCRAMKLTNKETTALSVNLLLTNKGWTIICQTYYCYLLLFFQIKKKSTYL